MTGKYLQNGVNEQSIIIAGVTDQLSQYYKQLNFTDKEYDIKKGFLVVIVAKESCIGAKSTDIQNDMVYAFRRLEMI